MAAKVHKVFFSAKRIGIVYDLLTDHAKRVNIQFTTGAFP